MEKLIQLKKISKKFSEKNVINSFSLDINNGEFITILGPSGCGKTTILRIIGGFENSDDGLLLFEGNDLNLISVKDRKINTVFQDYALFPHLDVYNNISFGLKNKKLGNSKKEKNDIIDIEVKKILKLVKLEGYEKRNVNKLSGGEKQRVAIARALINKPKLLLLDEPLSALDLKLRKQMQYELKDMQKTLGITFIFVTHDQEEALTMSDKVIVMNKGNIEQIGTPEDIYNEPKTKFVANFIGESNIIEGVYSNKLEVSILGSKFKCVDENFEINEKVDVVIRPEDFDVLEYDKGKLKGEVIDKVFKGVHYELSIIVDNHQIIIHTLEDIKLGEKIGLSADPYEIHLMKK